MDLLSQYITNSLPNKTFNRDLNGSFEKAISLLGLPDWDEKSILQVFKNHEADCHQEGNPIKPRVQTFPLLFSLNLVIVKVFNRKIESDCYYFNKYNHEACGYVYMAYEGDKYYPLKDRPFQRASVRDLVSTIEDKQSTSETFKLLLKSMGLDIPDLYVRFFPLKIGEDKIDVEATLFYLICYYGRTDLFADVLTQNLIDGVQERISGNTPLHGASFRGNFNIVVMLLFLGAKFITNKDGKTPNQFIPNQIPPRSRLQMTKIWKSYGNGTDIEKFKSEYANFKIINENVVEDVKVEIDPSLVHTNIALILTQKETLTLEELCLLLDEENPLPLPDFKNIISTRFNTSQINEISKNFKSTPFFLACKKGHFQIVQYMTTIPNIKLGGAQETYSNRGNTPLHVANWRGHTKIVALLLSLKIPLEPQTGGSRNRPNASGEKNFSLPQETRNTLQSIYRLVENRKYNDLKQFYEIDETAIVEISGDAPLPVWFVTNQPKEEIGQEYSKFPYIWYFRENLPQPPPLSIKKLTETSLLNYLYLRYRKNPQSSPFFSHLPIVPSYNFFQSLFFTPKTINWNYEACDVSFNKNPIAMKINNKLQAIIPVSRSKTWYYCSELRESSYSGSYLPFTQKISSLINDALTNGKYVISFPFLKDKGFFARPIICMAYLEENKMFVSMNNGGKVTDHKLISEENYNKVCSWEPEMFLSRFIDETLKPNEVRKDNLETEEETLVKDYFALSMPPTSSIVSVRKVLCLPLKKKFEDGLETAQQMHKDDFRFVTSIQYTKLLWYAPGNNDPNKVSLDGMKPNHMTGRLWGKTGGLYFSSEASYAANNAFLENGIKRIVLAKVIVGNPFYCEENICVDQPPREFHSLYTLKNGSWVYYVPNSSCAYPTYIVDFKDTK